MIKANELRIGNQLYDNLNDIFTVRQILCENNTGGNDDYWLIGSHCRERSVLDLQGIPLTPSLLEKCGFTKAYESFHDGIVIMNLHLHNVDVQFNNEYDKGIAVSNKGEEEALMFPCQYLHQLQNLIHSIGGVELRVDVS